MTWPAGARVTALYQVPLFILILVCRKADIVAGRERWPVGDREGRESDWMSVIYINMFRNKSGEAMH